MSTASPSKINQRFQLIDKRVYIEAIEEFRTLPYGVQDKLIQEFRYIYGPFFNFSEEYLARLLNHPKLMTMFITLARDRKTHKLVAVDMITIYHFEYIENDHRPENQYLTGHGIMVVDENFRMGGFVTVLTEISEEYLLKLYPNSNIVAYGFIITPYSYPYVMERSKLSIPGENIDPRAQKLFDKLVEVVPIRAKRIGADPFVMSVFPPVKNDLDFLYENMDRLPKHLKFYVEKTGLVPGVGLLTMQVLFMLKGNTAGLPAGDYIKKRYNYQGEVRFIQGKPTFNKPIPRI